MKGNTSVQPRASASTAGLILGRSSYQADDIECYLHRAQALLSATGTSPSQPIYWQGAVDIAYLALVLVAQSRGLSVRQAPPGELDNACLSAQQFNAARSSCVTTDLPAKSSLLASLIEDLCAQSPSNLPQFAAAYLSALPAAAKLALAAPLTHHYMIFLLICWQHGHTVCLDDSFVVAAASSVAAPAAITMRLFEQQRPQVVVADHPVLQVMMQHPAVDLADFDAVEQILVVCPGNVSAPDSVTELWPQAVTCQCVFAVLTGWLSAAQQRASRQQERAALETLLSTYPIAASEITELSPAELGVTVQLLPSPQLRDQRLKEADALIARSVPMVEARFSHAQALKAVALTRDLNHIALLTMLNGLWHCGVFSHHQVLSAAQIMTIAEVAPEHRTLIKRWLKVLTTEQLLAESAAGYRLLIDHDAFSDQAMMAALDEIAPQWFACMGSAGIIDYARNNARALPELIKGKVQAVHLLFQEGKTQLAKALYRENLISQYQHQQVANLVGEIASAGRQTPIRILEIGAGTGATSQTVLSQLAGLDIDYHYTDVSNFFFEQAADIVKHNPMVSLSLYDIDKAPEAQSFALYSFDIIIGGGVLNAARHTVCALQGLQRLLRPGGWLLITEPVQEEYWVMASQAFMLNQAEDDRSVSQATFLSLTQWQNALDEAGFIRLAEQPSRTHPFYQSGHFVFVATTHADYSPLAFAELQHSLSHAIQKPVSLSIQL